MATDQERRIARHVASGRPLSEALALDSSIVSLTDSSGGTASDTLADVTEAQNTGSADRVPTENAIASLAAKIEEILVLLDAAGIRD